ncbi:hypothetical protein SLE2022_112560 [Rubroshorea leprosula]
MLDQFQQNETIKKEIVNVAPIGLPDMTTSIDQSIAPPFKPSKPRVPTSLDRLEASLLRARAAIKEARNANQLLDPDYVPIGPMYRDAKTFHRCTLFSTTSWANIEYLVSHSCKDGRTFMLS